MPSTRPFAYLTLLTLLISPVAARADGLDMFQHGGRAMGQAGAMTARVDDPSAVFYNPAAIVRLKGFQLQAGLDFLSPDSTYESASGRIEDHHLIHFPPAIYATWKPSNGAPYAFGIGLDSPVYYDQDWFTALFPGRFLTRRSELTLFELHPVVSYAIDSHWSVGAGLRYERGTMVMGDNGLASLSGSVGPDILEVERTADVSVDGLGFDLSVDYKREIWGWGAVYRSRVNLSGSGTSYYHVRDVPNDPALMDLIARQFAKGSAKSGFTLPSELRGGVWVAPYPQLRLELDAALERWSELGTTVVHYDPSALGAAKSWPRDWKDTLSIRLGAEGDLNSHWSLGGGLAFQPSPLRTSTLDPGFPRGNATAYTVGATYNLPKISFDLGYSLWHYSTEHAYGQEKFRPTRTGKYTTRTQVLGFSARWRF